MPISNVPVEIAALILKHLEEDNPFVNLWNASQVSRSFAALCRPEVFRAPTLAMKHGRKSFTKHLEFFTDNHDIAALVQEIELWGVSSTAMAYDGEPWDLNPSEITLLSAALPNARDIRMSSCFLEAGYAATPDTPISRPVTLSLHNAYIIGTMSFPFNVIQHSGTQRLSLSFAIGTLRQREIAQGMEFFRLPVSSLAFPPSFPFPGILIRAMVRAASPTLREFAIDLSPVPYVSTFQGFGTDISLQDVENLGHLRIVAPIYNYVACHDAFQTWDYARRIIASVNPNIPHVTLIFECGDIMHDELYDKFAAFPIEKSADFLNLLSPTTQVRLGISRDPKYPLPEWSRIADTKPEWEDLCQHELVTLCNIGRGTKDEIFNSARLPPRISNARDSDSEDEEEEEEEEDE